ncbi:MAG: hypothetical protein J5482_03470 [Oscillospiraceae bacterium]|nr:hypothetical protein [Oscillospiraceae bacterium]
MFGYIAWERFGKPRVMLDRRFIGGIPFVTLEVRGEGRRVRRRVLRAAKEMERMGVRRCVMPEGWQAAWETGLRPVGEDKLRQALLPQLLSRFCEERGLILEQSTTLLCAPRPESAVWTAAKLLAQRSRHLILSVEGGEALRQTLWREYGLSAGGGGQAALQVCFAAPVYPIPALLLGSGCQIRQKVSYGLNALWTEKLGEYLPTPQLLTALWEIGALPLSAVEVLSLGNGA